MLRVYSKGSKSRVGQQNESSARPDLAVKMDYSNAYRENEELDEVLEVQLDGIHKNQYRMWSEKSQQLKQIRRQVEVIVRLRQAVNSRKPGDSIEIVSSARPRRFSRQASTVRKQPEKAVDTIDVEEIAKATRTQMRLSQERDKFSSKNLFNVVRRPSGFGSAYNYNNPTNNHRNSNNFIQNNSSNINNNSFNSNNNNNNNNSNRNDNRFFAPRKSVVSIPVGFNAAPLEEEIVDRVSSAGRRTRTSATSIRQRPETAHALKDNREEAPVSSLRGNRPKTAFETTRFAGRPGSSGGKSSPLPPKSVTSKARRSRSRRELEILCRMYSEIDEAAFDIDEGHQGEVYQETQRKQKLQQLRSEQQVLDLRVRRFLTEQDTFNHPKKTEARSGLSLYADEYDDA